MCRHHSKGCDIIWWLLDCWCSKASCVSMIGPFECCCNLQQLASTSFGQAHLSIYPALLLIQFSQLTNKHSYVWRMSHGLDLTAKSCDTSTASLDCFHTEHRSLARLTDRWYALQLTSWSSVHFLFSSASQQRRADSYLLEMCSESCIHCTT